MKQLTVRGVPERLGRRLAELARHRKQSLNATVLELLAEASGVSERRAWLERFTTWTSDEVKELDEATRAQRTIDARLWK